MDDTITIYAESILDVSPVNFDSIEVELEGVDIGQLVQEVGIETLLEEIGEEEIKEWLKRDKEND